MRSYRYRRPGRKTPRAPARYPGKEKNRSSGMLSRALRGLQSRARHHSIAWTWGSRMHVAAGRCSACGAGYSRIGPSWSPLQKTPGQPSWVVSPTKPRGNQERWATHSKPCPPKRQGGRGL